MIGKFLGKIKDYGTSVTNAGNPQVYVTLDFEHEGAQKTMTWYGSFVGGANDITVKTLINCGLTMNNFSRMADFKQGVASNLLDMNKTLELDIQEEPDFKDPTKMKAKIQWLNDPNSAPQITKIDDASNAQFFGSGKVESDLMRIAGEMGLSNQGQQNAGYQNQNQNQNANNGQQQNMNQNVNQNQNVNNGQQQAQNYNNNQQQNMNQQTHQNYDNQGKPQNTTQQQNNGQQQNGAGFKPPF